MAYDDSTNRVSFSSADLAISEAFCAPPFYPTSDLQSALLISPLCHPHTSQLPPLSFNPPSSSMDMPNVNNTVNDPCAQVVQVLLCYHQGGEDSDFVRKAIESLVKKLKDKQKELDALISAVTSSGKQATSCVTIHRSLDGRLQVAGRKGVPHVVYARIWRWPNVSKSELQKLPICVTSDDHSDLICINPFHYDRVVSSSLGTLDMSTLRVENKHDPLDFTQSPGVSMEAQYPSTSASTSFLMYGPHQQPSYVVSHLAGDNVSINSNSFNHLHNLNNEEWKKNSLIYNNNVMEMGPSSSYGTNRYNALRGNLERIRIPNITPDNHWCSISYYELDTQIGQTFKVHRDQSEVTIDGGMDPAGARLGRFCLGALSNVHRSEVSEKARIHIGRGIRLKETPDGAVYLQCLSQKGVFVRSYYLDFEHGLIYGSTVHKFCVGAEKKIFDLKWAFSEMCEQRQSTQLAVAAQACAVAGIVPNAVAPSVMERAGTSVDDLRRVCCTLAISFVKGWGTGYNRSTVKETPCWVEIQLHRPLQLLNGLLRHTE